MIESYIKTKRQTKEILLMTHIVIGYPTFKDSMKIVQEMVEAGVDLMELQIPFSEPMADGPVILKANQKALEQGSTVEKCMAFAEEVSNRFDIPFLFMSYYNILYQYGVKAFADKMKAIGIQGAIVPDLPPEEGADYIKSMKHNGLSPIYIFSPNTPDARMDYLSDCGSGFMYCVARKGVTGKNTRFSEDLDSYLNRCRNHTDLPLALGFGVKEKQDVEFLKGKADIAVIGSQTIRVVEEKGPEYVGDFIRKII